MHCDTFNESQSGVKLQGCILFILKCLCAKIFWSFHLSTPSPNTIHTLKTYNPTAMCAMCKQTIVDKIISAWMVKMAKIIVKIYSIVVPPFRVFSWFTWIIAFCMRIFLESRLAFPISYPTFLHILYIFSSTPISHISLAPEVKSLFSHSFAFYPFSSLSHPQVINRMYCVSQGIMYTMNIRL